MGRNLWAASQCWQNQSNPLWLEERCELCRLAGIAWHWAAFWSACPFSSEVVSLGVTLDSKLTWKPHIEQLAKKVNKALYSLRFIRACTTETLRKRFVESLVQPHLDYCTVVYMDASTGQREKVQRLSNACMRYITGTRRDEHITPNRQRLGWLRWDSRRSEFAALLTYKILRLREPSYLATLFEKHKPRPTSRGVQPELKTPALNYKTSDGAFQVQSVKLWNSLPPSLHYLPSFSSFKRAVHRHLLELDT